jgi:ElaB/YqjD/DUF883 family membrane-anchored ribosome-binding protein
MTTTDAYSETTTPGSTDEVRQKAEETAQTLASQAQEVASTQANAQMTRAASLLNGVAQSIHQTGDSMRDEQPQIASIADQAATRVEGISDYLRNRDFNDVVRDAESYARREPLLFLGAAFAVGFIAARFLKASAPQSSQRQPSYGVMDRSSLGRTTADYPTGYGTGYGTGPGNDYATASTGSTWSGGAAATDLDR